MNNKDVATLIRICREDLDRIEFENNQHDDLKKHNFDYMIQKSDSIMMKLNMFKSGVKLYLKAN
jgi:tRNA A37 threonylcarbamoyladenosine dehydratase